MLLKVVLQLREAPNIEEHPLLKGKGGRSWAGDLKPDWELQGGGSNLKQFLDVYYITECAGVRVIWVLHNTEKLCNKVSLSPPTVNLNLIEKNVFSSTTM